MVGKIRGFLILFLFFIGLGVAAITLALVDIDRLWTSTRRWAMDNLIFWDSGSAPVAEGEWNGDLEAAKLFSEAAFEAVKSGKAGAGDLYDLGRFYYRAKDDGRVDEVEMGRMVDMAEQSGIMDVVIDKFLEPAAVTAPPVRVSGDDLGAELKDLARQVKEAQAQGGLGGRRMIGLLSRVKASGLPGRVASMLPPGYDQTQAREAAREMAAAVTRGKVNASDVNTLFDMFIDAQSDGKLNEGEMRRLTSTAERLSK